MTETPCTCSCGYGSLEFAPQPFPPWVHDIMKVCMPLCGVHEQRDWPNSSKPKSLQRWHSDDEALFGGLHHDCCIISMSLGASRDFHVKLTDLPWFDDEDELATFITPGDSDLCTMEGGFQLHYKHAVPKNFMRPIRGSTLPGDGL